MSQLTYQSQQVDFSASQKAAFVDAERSLAMQKQAGLYDISKSIVEGVNKNMQVEFNNSMQAGLREAFNQNSADPDSFKEMADAQLDGLVKNAPMQLRQEMREVFNQNAQKYFISASDNLDKSQNDNFLMETLKSQDHAILNATESIPGLFNYENEGIQLDALSNLGDAYQQFVNNANATDSRGIPLFNARQRISMEDEFNGAIFSQFALNKMDSIEGSKGKEDFRISLLSGKENITFEIAKGEEITLSSRDLSQQQHNAINKNLENTLKNQALMLKHQEAMALVQNVIEGKDIADPKDKEYRESIDVYYNSNMTLSGFDKSTPEGRGNAINMIGGLISKSKAVPPSLESDLRAYLNSDDPEYFALAAGIVEHISINAPDQMQYIDDKDISKAKMMADNVRAGMTAKKAFENIQNIFTKLSPEIRSLRQSQFNELAKDESFSLDKLRTGSLWWKDVVTANTLAKDEFTIQYMNLTASEFIRTGDFKESKETALIILSKRWGLSSVNGTKVLGPLPAERHYENKEKGLDSSWMRSQADKRGREMSGTKIHEDDEILVTADRLTFAQAGDSSTKPTYLLSVTTFDEIRPILDKDNNEVRIGMDEWTGKPAEEQTKAFFTSQRLRAKRIKESRKSMVDAIIEPNPLVPFSMWTQ